MGPAIVASVAYMDPGNFATNIQAGAQYGYDLLWVVLMANLMAMLFQALSAKLGIVTGRNLAELCRDNYPKPVVLCMWVISEIAAMATDLAEFLGGAIGFSLLLGVDLMTGMIITAVITYGMLILQRSGFRTMDLIIGSLVGIIGVCYLVETVFAPPDWSAVVSHMVTPRLADGGAVLLAIGIVGCTVMPHAIFLHSGLMQERFAPANDEERKKLIGYSNWDVVIALGFAGLINMAMVTMAAAVFHNGTHNNLADIDTAYFTLIPLLGGAAASVYMISLIASGVSSSTVGTMAGQIIMQGFVSFRIPLWVRRLVTMIPAFAVIALGIDKTTAMVMSQVALSIVLPIPVIALILLTRRKDIMGKFANTPLVHWAASCFAAIILGLNLLFVLQMAGLGPF